MINGSDSVEDHPTGMAGIMVARGRGSDGLLGIAPAAELISYGSDDDVGMAASFRAAADAELVVDDVLLYEPGVEKATDEESERR